MTLIHPTQDAIERMKDAINSKDLQAVRTLLDQGFPVNTILIDGLNYTPLLWAASGKAAEICQLLIDRGANLEAKIGCGYTPLILAADKIRYSAKAIATCKVLLDAGASPNPVGIGGVTPLHKVINAYHDISEGRRKWEQGHSGDTYPHHALELIKLLMAYGASPSYTPVDASHWYKTPFQDAVEKGVPDLVRYFIQECGEDIAQRAMDKRSLLQIAKDPEVKVILRAAKTTKVVQQTVDAQQDEPTEHPVRRSAGMAPL